MSKRIYVLIDGGTLLGVYAEDNAEVYLLDLDQDDIDKSESLEHFNGDIKQCKELPINAFTYTEQETD
jgi:hypothetical protein